ncbi:hypothetical protein [uncultured Imperialibacter sp.]|uniref:hypothetical protein n=1 Tax=uncultured Imperialibacter sp. TaxID=1672639 RepID=UPI0030DC3B11|tara:strand:- start:24581 stop:25141 length:561 start_codon:yes stop_codon:yes gene_type:complete
MSQENFNFEDACKLVGIKVTNSQGTLTIRTLFNPFNKFGIGSIIFLIGGLTVGILSITRSKEYLSLITGSILGFGIGTVALLSILSELTSYFKISGKNLEFRNRLRLKTERITDDHKVKMKTRSEFVQLKSQPGSGSHFRIIELYISNGTSDQLIIDFQTDDKSSSIANQLGNELTYMVKNKIKSL